MPKLETTDYRVDPAAPLNLNAVISDDDGGLDRGDAEDMMEALLERLATLQEKLYAEGTRALLVVFQAMDTGGKDSTIRRVFGPLSPHGLRVWPFKAPSSMERRHDFLWRIHDKMPPLGAIHVLNRSHYEDVLIARVRSLVPEERWSKRFGHINDFERMLHDEGTTVVKLYLHISRDYQKKRFERRLERPDKHWKFNPADLAERALWDDYRAAYADVLQRCSTPDAPWYIVPAETRWFRDLLTTRIVVDTLERMNPDFPDPDFDPASITIPD